MQQIDQSGGGARAEGLKNAGWIVDITIPKNISTFCQEAEAPMAAARANAAAAQRIANLIPR